jgi:DNA helicase-2/ATP-dependent DNA helicase PcrA
MCNIYASSVNEVCKSTIKSIVGIETISISEIKRLITDSLYPNPKDEDIETITNNIDNFFQLSIDECERWYNYISLKSKNSIIYHTFHNTKGLEYNNVVIIMENDFGINKNFFKNYFENVNNDSIPEDEDKRKLYDEAKNLLYVSVTRAIKNLRILYIGQISKDTEFGLKKIFGELTLYKNQE